jgi:hypothetical protein
MPTKIAKNVFQGGMDKDTDPKQVKPTMYSDGYNVSTSQDNRDGQLATFIGATPIGTGLLASIGADHTDIKPMGTYEVKASYNNLITTEDTLMMLTFFYRVSTKIFYVRAVQTDGSISEHNLYTETLTTAEDTILSESGQYYCDCVVYKEAGTSYAYFSNGVLPLMKLPLVITKNGKGDTTPYKKEEIELIRRGFRGSISAIDVRYGSTPQGDLLCGTYQFAVRLHNNTENKYTKWGLLTNPAFIGIEHDTTTPNYGGVGYVSDGDINLTLTWDEDYVTSSLYTHYQLAVVENINGSDDDQLTVKVLQPETLSAATDTYNYGTNKPALELVDISELTTDDAAIRYIRTLAIKNNRMLLGGVEYHPLDYDNNDPIIANTTAPINERLTGGKSVAYRDPDNATNKVGYFRDELYRYGVVYEDKYGNYSKPKILDFSAVTANKAAFSVWVTSTSYSIGDSVSAGTPAKGYRCLEAHTSGTFATDLAAGKWERAHGDFKFPARSNSKYGALLETNGDIQALGLQINGLDNHPTWAVAAHIVRVPRKKKILFQTPLVPSILVQPAKAQGNYPDQRSSSVESDLPVLNVEAANPDGSFVPKNFYHVLPKNMIRFGEFYGEEANTNGSVYVSNTDPSNTFRMYGSDYSGGSFFTIGSSASETFAYTSSSNNDTGIYWRFGDGTSIIAGDTIAVDIYRRSIGGTSWTLWESVGSGAYTSDSNPSVGLDYSAATGYDYHISIGIA